MSDELETGTINGVQTASFYSHREHPWHALGTVTEDAKDAAEALRISHQDWLVEKRPIFAEVDGVRVQSDDKYGTLRVSPYTGQLEMLGVVGRGYTVVQNHENADFLDRLAGESGATYETAGSLRGGREVFISMRMPESLLIGGQDPVDLYLVATNTHDGSKQWGVMVTPVRVVCANTLRMGLAEAVARYTRRHTSGVLDAMQEVREALGVTYKYTGALQEEADRLLDQAFTDAEFARMTESLLPVPDDAPERIRHARDRKLADMLYLFTDAPTQATIRGTKWAAYNAVAEYVDWAWPANGGDKARQERVATSALTDRIESMKQRALLALR